MVNMWGRRAQIRNAKRLSHLFVLAMDTLSGLRPQAPTGNSTNTLTVFLEADQMRTKCQGNAERVRTEGQERPSADQPPGNPEAKCEANAKRVSSKRGPSAGQVRTKRRASEKRVRSRGQASAIQVMAKCGPSAHHVQAARRLGWYPSWGCLLGPDMDGTGGLDIALVTN